MGGWGKGGSTSHSASQETNIICSLKKGTRGTYCTEGKVQLCLEHKFGLVPRRTCGGESGGGRTTGREGNEREKNKRKRNGSGEDSRLSTSPPTQPPVGDFTFTSSKGSFAAQMWEPRGRAVPDMLTPPRTI